MNPVTYEQAEQLLDLLTQILERQDLFSIVLCLILGAVVCICAVKGFDKFD